MEAIYLKLMLCIKIITIYIYQDINSNTTCVPKVHTQRWNEVHSCTKLNRCIMYFYLRDTTHNVMIRYTTVIKVIWSDAGLILNIFF